MSKEDTRKELQNNLDRQTNANEKFLRNIESFRTTVEQNMRKQGRNMSYGEKEQIGKYKNDLKDAMVSTIKIYNKLEINSPQDREQNNFDKESVIKSLNEKFSESFRNQYSKEDQQKLKEAVNQELYNTNDPAKINQHKYQYKTQENKFLISGKATGDKKIDDQIIKVLAKQANIELVFGKNKSSYSEKTSAEVKRNVESLKELKKNIKNKDTLKYLDSKIDEFGGTSKTNVFKQTITEFLKKPEFNQIKNVLDKFKNNQSNKTKGAEQPKISNTKNNQKNTKNGGMSV